METGSYEGGSHANPGGVYQGRVGQVEGLPQFWRNLNDSREMGIIQAAIHDAAFAAGWKSIADYTLYQNVSSFHIFGTRKTMTDVTPRYCEFVRWMPVTPPVAEPLSGVANLQTPHERCNAALPDLIQELDAADENGNNYYVGSNGLR